MSEPRRETLGYLVQIAERAGYIAAGIALLGGPAYAYFIREDYNPLKAGDDGT